MHDAGSPLAVGLPLGTGRECQYGRLCCAGGSGWWLRVREKGKNRDLSYCFRLIYSCIGGLFFPFGNSVVVVLPFRELF
jgi:hypothetical protein